MLPEGLATRALIWGLQSVSEPGIHTELGGEPEDTCGWGHEEEDGDSRGPSSPAPMSHGRASHLDQSRARKLMSESPLGGSTCSLLGSWARAGRRI